MKPRRDDETRLRDRKGRYVEECEFCTCPVGCACDGEGCACGSDKRKKSASGGGVSFEEIRRQFEKGGAGV